jgi:8-oxo-dGTP pyrophosphatase MutT (NUDIX family)
MDKKDYTEDMPVVERYAVRALIKRDGLWAMQKSSAGYYKIPGGGVEKGETYLEALVREVQEETGLIVAEDSITEIGEILEIREDSYQKGTKYISHSFCYFCDVKDEMTQTAMSENEQARGYRLEWVNLERVIACNENLLKEEWMKRDTLFLKWLQENRG